MSYAGNLRVCICTRLAFALCADSSPPPRAPCFTCRPAGTISQRERPAGEAVNAEYLSSAVQYDDEDGRLMDAQGEAVMMGWEAPLMERHADTICAAVSQRKGPMQQPPR